MIATRKLLLDLSCAKRGGNAIKLYFHRNKPLYYSCHSSHSQPFKSYSTFPDIQNVKLITFDATGTFLTFRKPPFEIYKEIGEKHGIQCETERIKSSFKVQWKEMNQEQPHFGVEWRAWWTEYVIRTFKGANTQGWLKDEDKTLKKVALELIDYFRTIECWKLKDGTEKLMAALSTEIKADNNKLLAVGIISNFDPRLYQLLKLFEMDKLFAPIILSHEHGVSKPSQKIFNLALEAFTQKFPKENIKPSEALHVGDNYELDYLGAKQAGWKSCLIIPKFNILDMAEEKRVIIPTEDEVHSDLQSLLLFLTKQGKL